MTYRVKDLEKIIDRDRNTILRWEREGKISVPQKDSRGWRFYTQEDIQKIMKFVSENNPYYESAIGKNQSIAMSSGFSVRDRRRG